MFYFFRHDKDRHVMVITDKNATFSALPEPQLDYRSTTTAVGSRHAMGAHLRFSAGSLGAARLQFRDAILRSDHQREDDAQAAQRADLRALRLPRRLRPEGPRNAVDPDADAGGGGRPPCGIGRQQLSLSRHGPALHAGQPPGGEAIAGLRDSPGAPRGDRHQPPDPGPRRAVPLRQQLRGDSLRRAVPSAPRHGKTRRPRPADRHRRRAAGREDPYRQVRPCARAIPLGPLRQARRQELVLDPRVAVVGRSRLGRREPSPCRTRGDRVVPRGRSRSSADHRPRLQRRKCTRRCRCPTTRRRAG